MRLWSLHPKYLDSRGLVALWREALLAQKVLSGATRGYKSHPQLKRFKDCSDPMNMIGLYLIKIWEEADKRGYKFNRSKILSAQYPSRRTKVTNGQLKYEYNHLKKKLKVRSPIWHKSILKFKRIQANPIFFVIRGDKENWEK